MMRRSTRLLPSRNALRRTAVLSRGLKTTDPTRKSEVAPEMSRKPSIPYVERLKQEKDQKVERLPEEYEDEHLVGLTGGEIFQEIMKEMKVDTIFGYPGGAILPVFDGIYNSKDFNLVLPRHEQGAGHMAEGYARASGKPGVVLVTSGPGATNTITPMQDALMDGTPMVVFTGQVPTSAIGSDAFQEADVIGISRPCTKYNCMVHKIEDLPRAIREAFYIATTGRPGPVLVDLPKDVTANTLRKPIAKKYPQLFRKRVLRTKNPMIRRACDAKEWKRSTPKVVEMINKARRPVIYAGQGIIQAQAMEQLEKLAEKGNIPVTTTLQGLGGFNEYHPLSLHMLGMHGSAYANFAVQNADCVIAIGARFDDRVTGRLDSFAPQARAASRRGEGGIIHIELLHKNIDKTVEVDLALEADCGEVLDEILPHIEFADRKEWLGMIDEWKEKHPFTYYKNEGAGTQCKPQQVIEELDRQTRNIKDNVLITTGVGQHQMWAAQYYRWTLPRSMITSGGLGTMGYGLPAAIGAKLAAPEKIVVDIDGDASYCMTGMELMTASEFNIGVKALVLNNDFQGMVKQWQDLFYDERYSATRMTNPDFVKMAEAFHVKGLRCSTQEELPEKMKEFLEYNDGPVVMEVLVDKKEHVYPMVPAGKSLDEMVLGPSA
uniref:Acetolactate synthase n=1 Tax=Lotharella globosa TaxID=91324 RepID=A0A7S3Z001_9EUKA|mmetsp:Transcript_18229/g.36782  ORF Transcript_18229/g.36782 Transcript_18229/m.36782 type:complete len:660 (-) Transcript_18229:454-2433(-)